MSKIVFTVPPVDMEEIWGELSEEGSVLPPMGIAILASVTRGKGFDVKILDPIAEKLDIESTLKRIFDYNPKYVGITATTDMLSSAARLADRLKKIDPSYTILLGGPHISALPLDTMEKFASFDYGFVGESEDTLPEFLEAFEKKGDLSKVKGIVIRNSGKPVYTGPRQIIMDMDRIPMPAWDALPDIRSHYRPALINYKRQPVTSLVTSRGCAGMCIFCDASVFGRRVRAYSADYVMRSIDELMKGYGIKEVCFYDDTFVAFKKRLSEICNMMIERKLDLSW